MSTGEPATPEPGQSPSQGGGYQPPSGTGYPPPAGGYPPPGAEGGGYAAPNYSAPGTEGYTAPNYPPPAGQPFAGGGQQPYQGGYPTGATGQAPLSPTEERTWAMAAHLSSVLGIWVFFLGALGPLVVLLAPGQRSPYVRAQAIEALNFNISVLIYSIIAWILVFVLIGFLMVAALFVFWLLFTIIATVKVSNGEPYRYPLTIRLVH
ncbi:DUF4870 domain-containing protein [Pseudonocardia sp. Cha107L01]|uniref:DUF4870 domain-containing protein n=1 Tax=Pseudonocardia sp. Cha107L01 TaxID=3457576 RepID=UPI00403EA873